MRHALKAVFLSRNALNTWDSQLGSLPQRETGGMLVGYRGIRGGQIITAATTAGPGARRRWLSFEPDDAHDRALLHGLYQESGRIIRYLGEWHSHPAGLVRPSRTDVRTIRALQSSEQTDLPDPLSAIVGRRRGSLRWAVYRLVEGELEAVSDVRLGEFSAPVISAGNPQR